MSFTINMVLPFSALGIMGLGPVELVIALAILLLVLGPSKLPKLGAAIGKSYGNLKKGIREGKDEEEASIAEDASEGVEVRVEVQAPEALTGETEDAASEESDGVEEVEEAKVADSVS